MTENPDDRHEQGASRPRIGRWETAAVLEFVVIVALALLYAGRERPASPAPATHEHGPTAPMAAEKTWYTCPMHPQVVQDHPGTCPICGMTLVKKTSATSSGQDPTEHFLDSLPGLAPVSVPESIQQEIGARTEPVRKETIGDEIRTIGQVVADETRTVHVHARTSGWVTWLAAAQTGQKVGKNQVLLDLWSREVFQADLELADLVRNQKSAEGVPADLSTDLSQAVREKLAVLGKKATAPGASPGPAGRISITSPMTGFVTSKRVLDGHFVEPGEEMFTISDLSSVWVLAELYEQDIPRAVKGESAEVRIDALGDRTFKGRISFLDPSLDSAARTLRARIEIPNPEALLKPGMWATVRIQGEPIEALTVPLDAVVDTGTHTYVFVETASGEFSPRPVVVGRKFRDRIELLSGLKIGEPVLTSAVFLIDAESRIRGLGSQAAGPAQSPHVMHHGEE